MLFLDVAVITELPAPSLATLLTEGLEIVVWVCETPLLFPPPDPDLENSLDVAIPELTFGLVDSNELARFGIPELFTPTVLEGVLDPPRDGLGP